MNALLRNKVALVTGASRKAGIGAAIARELAKAGAHLSLAYYRPYDKTKPWPSDPDETSALIADLRGLGVRVEGIEVDLAEPSSAKGLIDRTYDLFGGLDILVNNAAHSESASVETLDAAVLDQHYAVNVRATALLCAEFARRHPRGRSGRIINLTSGQGLHPMPNELAYAASKGAIDALTVSLSARAGISRYHRQCDRSRPNGHRVDGGGAQGEATTAGTHGPSGSPRRRGPSGLISCLRRGWLGYGSNSSFARRTLILRGEHLTWGVSRHAN